MILLYKCFQSVRQHKLKLHSAWVQLIKSFHLVTHIAACVELFQPCLIYFH